MHQEAVTCRSSGSSETKKATGFGQTDAFSEERRKYLVVAGTELIS
jgi:hypothetical protein